MEACSQTLLIVYDIVKTDPAPETYLCSPHEILLRHTLDWNGIQKHLELLEAEKFISTKKLDKMVVSITKAGIEKVKTLKNNFVSKNFSFSNEKKDDVPVKL